MRSEIEEFRHSMKTIQVTMRKLQTEGREKKDEP